ncbi:hypothetical protein DFP72DRAFT_907517 [Ephemerocybe angulata]|uniref:Uncharacterized protein n=1 Tax=Ephemerocybe angulata TaxID=980116 RepID=A0A8H6M4Q7_9AGAR|nr:hypothetical protein DFP72DRAFT_907517 [Tulosesus angulatus]
MAPRKLDCPELELRSYQDDLASKESPHGESKECFAFETAIDVVDIQSSVYGGEDDLETVYKPGMGHEEIVEYIRGRAKPNSEVGDDEKLESQTPLLRILFVQGHVILPTKGQQEAPPRSARFEEVHAAVHPSTAEFLSSALGVSPAFFAILLKKTWVLKTGNCCWKRRVKSEHGDYDVIEGWYRYSCGLKNYPSHVWFSYTPTCTTYIMNNCKYNGIQDSIIRCTEGMASTLLRPLAIDGFVVEAASEAWGKELLKPRMTLVEYEHLDERKLSMDTSESVRELHILSYNLLIIKEDMVDHIERLEYLAEVHKKVSATIGVSFTDSKKDAFSPSPSNASSDLSSLAGTIRDTASPSPKTSPSSLATGICLSYVFQFLLSETQIRKRWVQSYADRTGIQINLFYALASQKDNYINLKIAGLTSKIATETQKDSSSMITMATMTMLFLPGTFVSTVFSMVFFDTSASPTTGHLGLSIAPSWWLYPVITIPLTILVFIAWNGWRLRRNAAQALELQKPDEQFDVPTPAFRLGGGMEWGRMKRYPVATGSLLQDDLSNAGSHVTYKSTRQPAILLEDLSPSGSLLESSEKPGWGASPNVPESPFGYAWRTSDAPKPDVQKESEKSGARFRDQLHSSHM